MERGLALGGFMAVGKTTVGRRVAERLGLPFVDLDAAVGQAAGRSVAAIFAEEGEAAFRLRERQVLASWVGRGPLVLALGGGALHEPETRKLLDERWVIVVLHADFAAIEGRLGARPLAPRARELYALRAPGYAAAGLRVDTDGQDVEAVAQTVCDRYRSAA